MVRLKTMTRARIISSLDEMQQVAEEVRLSGRRIGVVPTMGFLHAGHQSLIRVARDRTDLAITTVFVNPAQFAPGEDYEKYPRDFERDRILAEEAGTDVLFHPEVRQMYPRDYQTFVEVATMTKVLEGKSRPTHFRGVTTVVAKLLHLTKPHVAVFGQKDAQQAVAVKQMVRDLDLDVEIIVAPIVRERDGLALSSRNIYLLPHERSDAPVLYESLQLAERMIEAGERNSKNLISAMSSLIESKKSTAIDYISIADAERLEELDTLHPGNKVLVSLAVMVGKTRLIDNSILTV